MSAKVLYKNSKESTLSEDWVVLDTLFIIRGNDDKVIGIIDVRHNIDNEFLSMY